MKDIYPYILGSGNSARALKEAWAVLAIHDESLKIHPPVQLTRGQDIKALKPEPGAVLCICNPHGLHTQAILDGDHAKFSLIVCEKPACTSLEDIAKLRNVKTPVAVCHVYRQTWALQKIKELVASGEMGEIFSIEGRYWQSSAAQKAIGLGKGGGWKNDVALSGPSDVLLDIGVHWLDAALFLADSNLVETRLWLSYANSEASHRDNHVHLYAKCANDTRFLASISKTVHGAPNHFEINVMGTKKSATWKFLEADQIEVGTGDSRSLIVRSKNDPYSIHSPYHGLGWIEGYINTLSGAVRNVQGTKDAKFPKLAEHLTVVEALLTAKRD